jgi:hypothetical protein
MITRIESLFVNSATDEISQQLYKGYYLSAPNSFWAATIEDREEIINGCGPRGVLDWLIPDKIFGLPIRPACEIHDWCFAVWDDRAGFTLSNKLFRNNMQRIIWTWFTKTKQGFFKRLVLRSRMIAAFVYYSAVNNLGEFFYYDL